MKHVRCRRVLPCAAALVFLITPGITVAQVTILEVGPHGTYANIQEAIEAAVAGERTEVRVEGAHTYVENLQITGSFSAGTLSLLGGWNTTFTERVFLPQDTVVDGNQTGRVLNALGHAGDLIVDGFTLTNGLITEPGGGVRIDPSGDSQVTLSNVRILGNTSTTASGTSGGGLKVEIFGSQRLELTDCRVMDNVAGSTGGAVVAGGGIGIRAIGDATFLIQNCEIDHNIIESTGQVLGAGVKLELSDDAQGKLLDSSIVENAAYSTDVGAAGSYFETRGDSNLIVERTAIALNVMSGDLAPQLWASQLGMSVFVMRDSIFGLGEENGIDINADNHSVVHMVNLTVVDNGGVGIQLGQSGLATITMYNTISYGSAIALQTLGSIDADFNLIGVDPLFVNPANYDFRVQQGSPAINAGTNSPPGGLGLVDFDGNQRIRDLIVDVGCYEWSAEIFSDDFEAGDLSAWTEIMP